MKYAELCDVVGQDAALRLAQHIGGENCYIPKPPRQVGRKEKILALLKAGHPVRDVAIATNVSRRWVEIIRKCELQ
jgi:hypothetical protein